MLTAEIPRLQNPHTSTPSTAAADAAAAAAAQLDGAERVLDAAELSTILGRQVQITHARIKPRHSVVVAVTDETGHPGWVTLTNDADKFTKALQRASGVQRAVAVHRDESPWLFSGSMWTDPVLAKALADVRQNLGEQVSWKVLRYNPRRRVVAVVDFAPGEGRAESRKVVRVVQGGADRLLDLHQIWRQAEVPVTSVKSAGVRHSATLAPLWGVGDLLQHRNPEPAQTAGAAIARLHCHTRRAAESALHDSDCAADEEPHRCLPVRAAEAAQPVEVFAPWLAERAAAVSAQLSELLPQNAHSGWSMIHGDLSPDQVILADELSHKIRIIDLERSGYGHPMRDLGSWIAACRREDALPLIDAFLEGYAETAPLDPDALDAWEAYAHLASALDPFRHREPEWPQAVTAAIERAEEALRRVG